MNKAIIIGNLGKDPELRYTASGTAVCNFSMATTDRFKNKQGEQQESTEWHNIVAWGNLADICGKYLKKGSKAMVEGKLQTRSWDDKDGNKKYTTEINISNLEMLDSKPRQESADQDSSGQPFDPESDLPF